MSGNDDRVGFVSSGNGRGTVDLIWTCLFTWFLCLWAAFHPNIPAARDSSFNILARRLVYLLIGALGPETNPSKSFEQWQDAHFFLEEVKQVLPPPTTYEYDGPIDVSTNPEGKEGAQVDIEVVEPKPKKWTLRDGLQKSNLEDPGWTLRHGFYCNMGGYTLNFKGQQSFPVSRPQLFKLLKAGYVEMPNPLTLEEIKDKSKTDSLLKAMAVLQAGYFVAQVIARGIQHLPTSTLEVATLAYIACMIPTIFFWWHKPQDVMTGTPLKILKWDRAAEKIVHEWPKMFFLWAPFDQARMPRIANALVTNQEWPRSFTRWQDARSWQPFVGTAVIFAAVHAIAWNFQFSTTVERWLWRTSSLVILAIGLFSCFASWWRGYDENLTKRRHDIHAAGQAVVAGIYVLFRLYLFVEVWLEFRAMPAGVYASVDWTKFYPNWH